MSTDWSDSLLITTHIHAIGKTGRMDCLFSRTNNSISFFTASVFPFPHHSCISIFSVYPFAASDYFMMLHFTFFMKHAFSFSLFFFIISFLSQVRFLARLSSSYVPLHPLHDFFPNTFELYPLSSCISFALPPLPSDCHLTWRDIRRPQCVTHTLTATVTSATETVMFTTYSQVSCLHCLICHLNCTLCKNGFLLWH